MSIGTWCEGCGPHESLGVCSECGYAIEAGWVVTDEMVERAAEAYEFGVMPGDESQATMDEKRSMARRVLTAAFDDNGERDV